MGLLDKAKKRAKQTKSRKTVKPVARTTRTRSTRAAPSRGLLHRAKHRKKEVEIKQSTKFKRELEAHKIDATTNKEDTFKERERDMVSIGPLYSTTIDKIYHHVKKVKRMPIKDLMTMFSLKRSEVERWANILDEEKLLDLYYPPMGEPELRLTGIEVSKKNKAKTGVKVKGKSSVKPTVSKTKKTVKIAIVSAVFAVVMIFAGIYILSPNLLDSVSFITDPILGSMKYIYGQIILLIGG